MGIFAGFVDDPQRGAGRSRGGGRGPRDRAARGLAGSWDSRACCTAPTAICCRTPTVRCTRRTPSRPGLDYPGRRSRALASCKDSGRATYVAGHRRRRARGFELLSRAEGDHPGARDRARRRVDRRSGGALDERRRPCCCASAAAATRTSHRSARRVCDSATSRRPLRRSATSGETEDAREPPFAPAARRGDAPSSWPRVSGRTSSTCTTTRRTFARSRRLRGVVRADLGVHRSLHAHDHRVASSSGRGVVRASRGRQDVRQPALGLLQGRRPGAALPEGIRAGRTWSSFLDCVQRARRNSRRRGRPARHAVGARFGRICATATSMSATTGRWRSRRPLDGHSWEPRVVEPPTADDPPLGRRKLLASRARDGQSRGLRLDALFPR